MISLSCMPRRWFWFCFVIITLLATVTRLWQLGSIPVSVYWDEVAMLVDIKSILATGQDMHGRPWYQLIYPSYGDFKLPVYIWLATGSAQIFGLSEFALRLPSAITGILTAIVAGLLGKSLLAQLTRQKYSPTFLDQTQLWTMLIVAISPWSIMFSRTGFEGHIGQLLLTTSMYLTLIGLTTRAKYVFWLAPTVGGLATYSYFSVRFVWVVVYLGLCGLIWCRQYWPPKWKLNAVLNSLSSARSLIAKTIGGLLLFGLVLLPLLRSPLADDADKFRLGTASVLNNDQLVHESNLQRQLAGNTRVDRLFYNRPMLLGRELLKNYSDNLSPSFLFIHGDPNLRHGTGQFGLFYLIFAPFLLIGLVVLFKRHPLLTLFLVGWWLLALLPASVPENTPHALRSLNALVPVVLIIGFGLTWFTSTFTSRYLQLALLVVVGVSFAHFWWLYTTIYPKVSADDWQSGYKPLALEITSMHQRDQEVFIIPFDDRFYLWLMAYGSYPGEVFRDWQSKDYKFVDSTLANQFSGVEFSSPEDNELQLLLQENRPVILVGESATVSERCQQATAYACTIKTIFDEAGQPKFQTATLATP